MMAMMRVKNGNDENGNDEFQSLTTLLYVFFLKKLTRNEPYQQFC